MSLFIGIGITLFASIIGAFGAFYLKKSSLIKSKRTMYIIIGGSLYGTSALFFIYGLQFAPVNVLTPITATTWIWSALLAKKKLKEQFNKNKILGITLIILSVVVLAVVN